MSKIFLHILVVFLGAIILTLIILLIAEPKVSVKTDNITISTKAVHLYIPSLNPIKIYKFNPAPDELRKIIDANIKDSTATFGIFIKNLSTGQEVALNAEEQFASASLYKLAVMFTLFQKQKEVKLEFTADIQKNLEAMIERSSNEASFYLVEKYSSWKEIDRIMKKQGLENTNFYAPPLVTTPKDIGKLLEKISSGEAVDMDASISMLKLLSKQKINDRIPVFIPSGVIVAHKTGELEDTRHDAGVLIGPDNNIVVVLMTKDSKNPEEVKPVMAKLAFEVYEFFRNQWENPPEIL